MYEPFHFFQEKIPLKPLKEIMQVSPEEILEDIFSGIDNEIPGEISVEIHEKLAMEYLPKVNEGSNLARTSESLENVRWKPYRDFLKIPWRVFWIFLKRGFLQKILNESMEDYGIDMAKFLKKF